ncbi:Neurochondrin-domain-containing protein [Calycina marina]|uniref:Neurochondrin-domain-containing protein n=1 Tax=Calycina marina TaxID=1763456 RepID=A0A9P7Z7U2_9HELO|nr:Neurochondrin-domain-containing protein [Calycina marina]
MMASIIPAVPSSDGSNTGSLTDASQTYGEIQRLLKAKDDTSRFVGLALLKSVLDNGQLVNDPVKVRTLWESLSPKFFDRLLRARSTKVQHLEANAMVDVAVSVLHTFSTMLPEASRKEKRLVGRVSPLLKALIESPPETRKLILQTLLTISSQPEGASEILSTDDTSQLVEIAAWNSLALDVLRYTWTNAATLCGKADAVKKQVDRTVPELLRVFNDTDAVTLVSFCGSLLADLDPKVLSSNPKWLEPLVSVLRRIIASRPTSAGRAAYTQLAAIILQHYPLNGSQLLFNDDYSLHQDSKPFSYLFVNLLLIDLRSSFPTLLEQLNDGKYPEISRRLAGAFDVLSGFIGCLVKSLDDETNSVKFSIPPDLLLKLRKDIAETMSLTIEYLRDRWDASIAGTSGLHPSARTGTSVTSEGARLTITWESKKDSITGDPLILAAIRCLAIWIREDENENLRNESSGLMDMFVELYKMSDPSSLDFRYPILLALEGMMTTEDGVENFLGQEGWQAVGQDLQALLRCILNSEHGSSSHTTLSDAARGLEIVRVLLAVVDSPSTDTNENWMAAIGITTSMKPPSKDSPPIVIELQIAMVQISTALLSKAAGGMKKRGVTSIPALSGLTRQLQKVVGCMENTLDAEEFTEQLDDVELDLENLRLSR